MKAWNWTDLAFMAAPLVLGVGLTRLVTPEYRQCGRRPSIQPPGWAFATAWTVLYALAGVSLALAWRDSGRNAKAPQVVALICALVVMMLWWVVFSNVCRPSAAFWALLAVLAGVAGATEALRRAGSVRSALLLVPLVAWLCFASLLQFLSIK